MLYFSNPLKSTFIDSKQFPGVGVTPLGSCLVTTFVCLHAVKCSTMLHNDASSCTSYISILSIYRHFSSLIIKIWIWNVKTGNFAEK